MSVNSLNSGRYGKPVITPGRLVQLAEAHSPAAIADRLGIDEEEVLKALEAAGRKLPKLVLVCQKSGRWWKVRSERGAYRQAQLLGLVDWTVKGETA
jgi:hypothetical protein